MSKTTPEQAQGHWLLAQMGKKVLRPGGKELTLKLLEQLDISETDNIVEFAPGLGFTTFLALKNNPQSYTGVELNEKAAENLQKVIKGNNRKIVMGNAANTNLENASADKVYGEAMLTMQGDNKKSEIIREAHRLLRTGGLYGIHELGLMPDDVGEDTKATIQRELAQVIKVNARPLTQSEWISLLKKEGFKIKQIMTNPMHLLEPKRIIDDEGLFRTLKIGFNILTHFAARKRILAMRQVFRKYGQQMNAIAIIAEKC